MQAWNAPSPNFNSLHAHIQTIITDLNAMYQLCSSISNIYGSVFILSSMNRPFNPRIVMECAMRCRSFFGEVKVASLSLSQSMSPIDQVMNLVRQPPPWPMESGWALATSWRWSRKLPLRVSREGGREGRNDGQPLCMCVATASHFKAPHGLIRNALRYSINFSFPQTDNIAVVVGSWSKEASDERIHGNSISFSNIIHFKLLMFRHFSLLKFRHCVCMFDASWMDVGRWTSDSPILEEQQAEPRLAKKIHWKNANTKSEQLLFPSLSFFLFMGERRKRNSFGHESISMCIVIHNHFQLSPHLIFSSSSSPSSCSPPHASSVCQY